MATPGPIMELWIFENGILLILYRGIWSILAILWLVSDTISRICVFLDIPFLAPMKPKTPTGSASSATGSASSGSDAENSGSGKSRSSKGKSSKSGTGAPTLLEKSDSQTPSGTESGVNSFAEATDEKGGSKEGNATKSGGGARKRKGKNSKGKGNVD
jgi:hypothetical protein